MPTGDWNDQWRVPLSYILHHNPVRARSICFVSIFCITNLQIWLSAFKPAWISIILLSEAVAWRLTLADCDIQSKRVQHRTSHFYPVVPSESCLCSSSLLRKTLIINFLDEDWTFHFRLSQKLLYYSLLLKELYNRLVYSSSICISCRAHTRQGTLDWSIVARACVLS